MIGAAEVSAASTASGQGSSGAPGPTASGQVSARSRYSTMPKLMVDLNCSISRLVTSSIDDGEGEITPCILPNQCLWVHLQPPRVPRLMLGREALLFQGWPISKVTDTPLLKNRFLQDLAGNGVTLPVMLAIVMATCRAISWKDAVERRPGEASSTEDINHALALLIQVC